MNTNVVLMTDVGVEDEILDCHYKKPHWARETTETSIQIGKAKYSVVSLIDYGSEVNLISNELYQKGKWLSTINHGWKIHAATTAT